MKILIAPNSLKECVDSVTLAEIFSSNLSKFGFNDLISKPISDGGDGFLNVCNKIFSLERICYKIPTPDKNNLINCDVGYSKKDKTIYIESAKVLGLNLIPSNKRHPLYLSSEGMGVLLKKIMADIDQAKIEVKKIKVGIGGTGTNDMGIGLASIFGLKLFDKNNKMIDNLPKNFYKVKTIKWQKIKFPFSVELVTDVTNPLLGKNGASRIFGKQKGLTSKEIKVAERGFANIVGLLKKEKIISGQKFISGAGGGLAAAFQIFLKAKIIHSDKFILHDLKIKKERRLSTVITAEGAFDEQSFMNKATGIIINKFANTSTKIFLVCGIIDGKVKRKLPSNVFPIEISKYFKNKTDSIKHYKKGINLACKGIVSKIS